VPGAGRPSAGEHPRRPVPDHERRRAGDLAHLHPGGDPVGRRRRPGHVTRGGHARSLRCRRSRCRAGLAWSLLNRPRFYAHFLCWKDGAMSIRYDENTKARAVRLVREHRDDYESEWAAIKAISGRLGMNPETLRKWVRQTEIDAGEAPGVSSEERRELRELRRKCRELESTIVILSEATSFFARECDPRHR